MWVTGVMRESSNFKNAFWRDYALNGMSGTKNNPLVYMKVWHKRIMLEDWERAHPVHNAVFSIFEYIEDSCNKR